MNFGVKRKILAQCQLWSCESTFKAPVDFVNSVSFSKRIKEPNSLEDRWYWERMC